jgi:hypothetical protein
MLSIQVKLGGGGWDRGRDDCHDRKWGHDGGREWGHHDKHEWGHHDRKRCWDKKRDC